MKRAIVAAALLCGLLLMGGAIRPDRDPGLGGPLGVGFNASTVKVDTVRIVTQTTTLRNTAARVAGYITARDTVGAVNNSADNGGTVRWGWMQRSNSSTAPGDSNQVQYITPNYYFSARGGTGEDDAGLDNPGIVGLVWVSANGLPNGSKINKAQLIVNLSAFGGTTIGAGQYLAARLDTVSTDYRILNNHLNGRFRASWTKVDSIGGLAWNPTLSSRRDRHDFGPRSDNIIGPGTYGDGAALRFLVTDAVQQASDNGTLGRGLLFMIYGSSGVGTVTLCGGTNTTYCGPGANNGKGLPIFTAISSSRRGEREWGGVRVPIALTFDDQYDVQVGYFTAMEAGTKTFDAAIYNNAMAAHTWVDSLHTLKPTWMNFIHHTKTHPSMGNLTGEAIDPELTRKWMMTTLTGYTAADTAGILDWAWPGGGASPVKSLEVMSRLYDFGYRSGRGFGAGWLAAQAGAEYETYLGWSNWVNKYQIKATGATSLFGSGAAFTDAQMDEELGDLIDQHYTDYGKAAIIIYGHRYDSAPADYISPAGISHLIAKTNALNSAKVMSYKWILDRRFAGVSPVAADRIAEWVSAGNYTDVGRGVSVDSNAIQKYAAHQDSAYEASSNANLLKMWIAPK